MSILVGGADLHTRTEKNSKITSLTKILTKILVKVLPLFVKIHPFIVDILDFTFNQKVQAKTELGSCKAKKLSGIHKMFVFILWFYFYSTPNVEWLG